LATNNVDLYSYLPGIELTADELLNAELLAYQILSAKFPDLDLREGTGLRDLVIRPNATLLAMTQKAMQFYFAQNTISGVTEDTPRVFVDKLLSNFFMSRKEGNQAVLNARLFFAKSKSVSLPSDVFFSPDNTLKFFPSVSASYSEDQLVYDSASNQYYLDVDLTAEKSGVAYNITGGSLIYFSSFDPFFLHAEINFLRQTAEDLESNSAFIKRTEDAISTRNLINVPSIASRLLEDIPLIEQVTTFGFGDVEMIRDQIKIYVPGVADPVWIHNGGKVDVFCRTPLSSSIVQLLTDSTGKINLSGSIYKFNRSTLTGGQDPDTVPVLDQKSVTSLTRTGSLATATVTAHGYSTGDVITIQGAIPNGYNGTGTITVTDANTFTYPVNASLATPATGTITSGKDYPYTVIDSSWASASVTGITRSASVATATSPDHGFVVGERVAISGANQAGYNGNKVVTSIPTKDTFTFDVDALTVTPATGTMSAKFVKRQEEFGFSDSQNLVIDFGVGQANKTASFVVYFHQNIDGIQAYLNDPERRVVCGDYLARGHNLTALDITVTGYNAVAPDAAIASATTKDYLASLNPGEPFIMADLLSKLYTAGITTIKTPLDVTYTKYWNDNLGTTTGTITDFLNPSDTKNIFVLNTLVTTSATI
jgi:hypothetical protein